MIVHLVQFHKGHRHKPPSFALPTLEDLAFLIQIHTMNLPRLCLDSGEYLKFLSDPFLLALFYTNSKTNCIHARQNPVLS